MRRRRVLLPKPWPWSPLCPLGFGLLVVEVEGVEGEGDCFERFGVEAERLRDFRVVIEVVMLVERREKRGFRAGAQAQSWTVVSWNSLVREGF